MERITSEYIGCLVENKSFPNNLKKCRRSRFNNASHQQEQIKLIKCSVEFPRVSSLNNYCWPKIAPFAEIEEMFRKATLILAAVVICLCFWEISKRQIYCNLQYACDGIWLLGIWGCALVHSVHQELMQELMSWWTTQGLTGMFCREKTTWLTSLRQVKMNRVFLWW